MKISGFTIAKNTSKLYYPIKAVVECLLPLVDEFVVALGDCDPDDTTRAELESIDSPKVKIIDTVWDIEAYPNGMENAHQTDIAKEACSGDWLFYLQADEVVHEKYLDHIREMCEKYLDDQRVDGFLFKYIHFFGDYWHYNNAHSWYPREIRIVRNDPEIHSHISAQSFRRIPNFDGKSYRQKEGTYKLNVVELDAYVYHYGWVRPPALLQAKDRALYTVHHGEKAAEEKYSKLGPYYDYGNMARLPEFRGTHPKVMADKIAEFDWADQLNFDPNHKPDRKLMKHEKTKYQIVTWIEQKLLGGRQLFGYSNWNIIS